MNKAKETEEMAVLGEQPVIDPNDVELDDVGNFLEALKEDSCFPMEVMALGAIALELRALRHVLVQIGDHTDEKHNEND
jgi:hypothetical protein